MVDPNHPSAPEGNIDLTDFFQALTLCTSSLDSVSVRAGEDKLQHYTNHRQFLSALGTVISDERVPDVIKTLASILFRNSTEKFWRNGPHQILEKDKQMLRGTVFNCCFGAQPVATLKQLLATIGKIVRFDFPRYWPSVIDEIGQKLGESDEEIQYRAIRLLHECARELATKRLPIDRKAFSEVCGKVFSPILNIFRTNVEKVLLGPVDGTAVYDLFVKKALYSAKVLHTLLISAIRDHARFPPFADYWNFFADASLVVDLLNRHSALERLPEFQLSPTKETVDCIRKIAERLLRTILGLMEEHPLTLAPYLQRLFAQVVLIAFGDTSQLKLSERILVTALNIVKVFHSERSYRSTRLEDGPEVRDFVQIRESFFDGRSVPQIIDTVVLRYLPLTEEELEKLENDTEEYCNEIEAHENWRFCLRSSAESLLSALCYCNPDVGSQKYFSALRRVLEMVKQTTIDRSIPVMRREAIYLATGLAAFHLFDTLDFDGLFRDHLWVEFQNKSPENMLLRRRILWLIGEWCSVRLANESRAVLFKMLVEGLIPSEHLAVRLMAAKVVKATVDIFEFRADDMIPVAPAILEGLLQLTLECTCNDSQVVILNSLNITLERLESHIQPFIPQLLHCLSTLWKSSSDNHLVQCGIAGAVKTAVRSMRREAAKIENFACELIDLSVDLMNPVSVHLLTDGLELWTTLLQNSEFCGDCLRKLLVVRLPALLDVISENMELVKDVVENYMVLCPDLFYSEFYDKLVLWAAKEIPELKDEGIALIIKLLDLSVQVFDAAASPKLVPALIVLTSSLPNDGNRVFALKMGLLARCLYSNFGACAPVFAAVAVEKQAPSAMDMFHGFVKLWTDQITWISKLERTKLCGLALMRMLVDQPEVMAVHFPAVSLALVDILSQLSGEGCAGDSWSSGGEIDLLNLSQDEFQFSERFTTSLLSSGTFDEVRRQELRNRNICYSVDMIRFMKDKWKELAVKVGDEFIRHLWEMLDVETKEKFAKLVV